MFCGPSIHSQDTQFLSEVDANLTVNSYFRTYLQAKIDREGGDPTRFTFGPSVQFYLKPLLKLKQITLFDLDDAKKCPLVIESGYRIIATPNTANENRALEAVTFHLPLFAGILLTDRNRADLDWKNGDFTWRYRNRLALDRTFAIHSYHLIPYVAPDPSTRASITSGALPIFRPRNETQRASSQVLQFPAELQNRDKQFQDARNEIQRINQLRSDDTASLAAQQVRIAELSDPLRVASSTLDLERQLTAAGKDIRELLTARELHVIDVRDTDVNGEPTKAFGRIFVTEGKSLTFYVFDLNQDRAIDAKHRFAV